MRATFVFIFMLLGCTLNIKAQTTDYKAYSLYVYNFMKYIEWPENQNKGDFIIHVLGKSPIEKELLNLSNQKKIRGRTIRVKTIESIEEIGNCHLLYLSKPKSSLIREINSIAKNKELLIIGEKEGLAYKGASISFATLEDDGLSFDINKKVISQHMLKISASLVKLGTVVVE